MSGQRFCNMELTRGYYVANKVASPNRPAARFTLVLEFEEAPDRSDLDELVDNARGFASITVAQLEILRTYEVDLS